MIVPMYKYSFLIYHKEYESFLAKLQDLGVVHVADKNQEISDELRESFQKIKNLKEVLKFLEKREVTGQPSPGDMHGVQVMENVNELREQKDNLQQQKAALAKQLRQVEPWGDYSLETVEKLKEQGVHLHFFVVSEKNFKKSWQDNYNLAVINQLGSELYFVVFTYGDEQVELEAEEVPAPKKPLSAYRQEQEKLQAQLDAIEQQLDAYASKYTGDIRSAMAEVQETTDYMSVKENTGKQAEDKVMLLEGWVPGPKKDELLKFLDEEGVLYVQEDKLKEKAKNIPVLLRNNRFASLFEDLGGLFSLPHARELDMTPFFAPFFAMFFGFCLGDAGYGILYLIIAAIIKRKKPEMKSIMTMIQVLGFTTILFGLLTGVVFGVNIPQNEAILKMSEPLREYKDAFINNQELFNLAIYVGIFQIIFGMFLKVANKVKQYGWLYAVSTMGWILLVIASLVTFGFLPEASQEAVMPVYKGVAVLSGAMILFFSNPSAGILGSFGAGIWDVYQMVTGLLGDVLSYIRLFALGIATAILGFVFNQMAVSLSPSTPVFGQLVFVIILFIGHGINIFMASLGALVHPMRLTFVEFYKNAGFEGGGKAYAPFKKQKA